MTVVYEYRLTPDVTVQVEDTGNIVLATPERRITVTHVQEWIDQLAVARTLAQAAG